MLNDSDQTQMQRDYQSIIEDRKVSVIIHRGETTLAAQNVRVARLAMKYTTARNYNTQEAGSREMRASVLVSGAPDLNIRVADRFNVAGSIYRVRFVRPNRAAETQAEAEMVE